MAFGALRMNDINWRQFHFTTALKMKFEVTKEEHYDSDFVAKIQESRQQVKEGKTVKIELDDLWKE